MKKQAKIKKLALKKETLTGLEYVMGGSYLYDTVYRPAVTEYQCATNRCGNA